MTRRIIQPEEALTLAPANHKILVRAPQVTPNRVLPAAMARIPLHNPARLKVHQDRFVIRLVDQQELVVAADGERRGAGVQFVVVQVLARGEAVDVDASLLVHGHKPALVVREGHILGPVRHFPCVETLAAHRPLAEGHGLVEGPCDEGLPVGCPGAAAYRLAEAAEHADTFPCL